jgi:O-antigen/teichoic acid export membrane protein
LKKGILARAISGSAVGIIAFGFTLLTNLVQVTLLLSVWTQEQYGHWLLLLSAATMATALDGGHQLYIGNQLNREQVEDRQRMLVTLGSAVRVAAFLGLVQIIFLGALVASGWIFPLIGLEADTAPGLAFGLLAYTVLWIGSGSVGSILVRLFVPAGYYVRSTWWNLSMRACQFFALIVLVNQGASLFTVALVYGLVAFGLSFLVFWDLKRLLPEYWPWWQTGSLKIGFRNFFRSSVYTCTNLLDNISQQGLLIIITHGLGALAVPLFTTLRTVSNMAMQGGGFLLNPVTPDIVRFRVTEQHTKLVGLFKMYWLALTFCMNLGLVLLFAWVEPLYNLWTKGKLAFDIHLFLWLAIAVLFRSLGLPFVVLLQSLNRLRIQVVLSCVRVGLCVLGSLLLMQPLGLSGVALAITLSELVGSLALPCWFVLKELRDTPFAQLGMGWSLAGTGLTAILLGLCSLSWLSSWQLTLLAALILAVCAYKQWRQTDADLRHRLLALLPAALRKLLPC